MFPINQLIQGDCKRVLKQLPDSCVDLIVTDPPYGVCYQDNLGRTIVNDDDPSRVFDAVTNTERRGRRANVARPAGLFRTSMCSTPSGPFEHRLIKRDTRTFKSLRAI
jgi:tRNA G10  N-methylase Trm11